jgi:hypothetical protein
MSDTAKIKAASKRGGLPDVWSVEVQSLCKEISTLRRGAKDLARCIEQFVEWLDREMKKPSSVERGQRIAQACNEIELAKDCIKHRIGLPIKIKRK